MKSAGILMHISSLPTEFGIGDLGQTAYRFADLLHEHGQKYWQILPLNWCGYSNSPYNPISAFATFPYLISPELLFEDGLVSSSELDAARLPNSAEVDYISVYQAKDALFTTAVECWLQRTGIEDYIESNASDLKPFLAYVMLCEIYGNDDWYHWLGEHRTYSAALYDRLWHKYSRRMSYYAVLQAIFEDQFHRLHQYLRSLDIKLIGDLPLYCSYQSADVWANQQLFDLDDEGKRRTVAGVPPDAFSETGQLWGNPTFRWDVMQNDGFDWWLRRIGNALKYNDLLRLDHFIGYVNYWSIDASEETAVNGRWIPAPAEIFFAALFSRYDRSRFIAEDLGILNAEVCRIRDKYALPGMIILQFCFDNPAVDPDQYPEDRIIYTGTHDNDTIMGWYRHLIESGAAEANIIHEYLQRSHRIDTLPTDPLTDVNWHLIDIAYASPCHLAIVPFQDILGLGTEARINTPGIPLGNWHWRLIDETYLNTSHYKWNEMLKLNLRYNNLSITLTNLF